MDVLIQYGIDWTVAIQSLGSWLRVPMSFFTFLGSENFFFLALPLVYWSIDARLGLRVAFILAASNYLFSVLKIILATPRPFWVSARVQPWSVESSFGAPSGHAQNAAAMWGVMAAWLRKPWAWVTAFLLVFLIGFSRLYLGMHFPHDVLAGWLLGLILLTVFLKLWEPVARWIQKRTLVQQVLLAFVISLVMGGLGLMSARPLEGYVFPAEWEQNARRAGPLPDPVSIAGSIASAASLFGFAAGAAWTGSRGGYQACGPLEKRTLRYVVGVLGIMVFWYGLGQVFPRGETWMPLLLRYIRYSLVGLWVTAGAPGLFFRFKLADRPKM